MFSIKDIAKKISWLLAYLIIMLPMCFSIYYSVPACDDFAAAVRNNGKGLFAQALNRSVSMWWTWGGRWLTQFFQVVINPLNSHEHLGHKYGVYMIVMFFITSIILIYSIRVLVEKLLMQEKSSTVNFVTFITVALFFTTYYYSECYNWFVGAMVFTVSLPLTLLAMSAMVRYAEKHGNQKVNYMVMIVAAVFPATIELWDPPLGLAYVYIIYYCHLKERIEEPVKEKVKNLVPLFIYILLGISNVFAPGNFVRKEYYGLETSVVVALKQFIIDEIIRAQDIIVDHPFAVLLFLILIVVGVASNHDKAKPERILDFIVFMVLMTTASVMPYIYARGFTNTYLDIRVEYVLDFCILVGLAFICVKFGQWLAYKFTLDLSAKNLISIIAVLILFSYATIINNYAYLEITQVAIIRNAGLIKSSYAFWDDVLTEIENSPEDDVVIVRDEEPTWSRYFYATGMIEGELYSAPADKIYDEEFIMPNVYYGKNSIEIKYSHDDN